MGRLARICTGMAGVFIALTALASARAEILTTKTFTFTPPDKATTIPEVKWIYFAHAFVKDTAGPDAR
jgi:hypothetical protein